MFLLYIIIFFRRKYRIIKELARNLYIYWQPKNLGQCPIARLNKEARCRANKQG
jgi:hypothetical protein